MRKNKFFLLLPLVLFTMAYFSSHEVAAEKKKIIFSTTDISQEYDIMGIVSYRTGETDIDVVNRGLLRRAKNMKATHVIGIRYHTYAGYFYGYGTAVKVKE